MKLNIITQPKSVVVITPTIGKKELLDCTESVSMQSYKNLHHLVVVDGGDYFESTFENCVMPNENSRIQITCVPENTGQGKFYGHRIYAAYPHLVNEDYVFFLDEDNWYDPDHVSSLVDLMESKKLDWAYSLRNICYKDGSFLEKDCCESLGRWPIFWSLTGVHQYLIDTSTFCFNRKFLTNVCHYWHTTGGKWGADRAFYESIKTISNKYETSGIHSLNYRLDDHPEKKYGDIHFFKTGNEYVLNFYGKYPWR